MGGESEAAWRALLDDLVNRGLKTPELVIVDGAAGLEKALARSGPQRGAALHGAQASQSPCARADRLHDEISADYNDMIYANSKNEIEAKHKAFIRKWRLKCRAVADSLEEAGDKLFTFTRFPKSQWNRSAHRMQSNVCTKSSNGGSRTDRVAVGGNRGDVVLGFARFWSDHDAQSGRLAKPKRKAIRSDD